MRRTAALAHVGHNVVTGLVALASVTLAAPRVRDLLAGGMRRRASCFIARCSTWRGRRCCCRCCAPLPARSAAGARPGLSEPLDRRLLADPEAAMDAARGALARVWRVLAAAVAARLRRAGDTAALGPALDDIADSLTGCARPPRDATTCGGGRRR